MVRLRSKPPLQDRILAAFLWDWAVALQDSEHQILRKWFSKASTGTLDDCLCLLKGNSDEQRLVGLLLASKFVQGDDKESILKVFDAIGIQFINRLLKSGGGGEQLKSNDTKQEQPYLQLAVTILAAFCRVPELASLDDIIAKVPTLVQTLAEKQEDSAVRDCYECLIEIGAASEKGLVCVQQSRALPVVAGHLCSSPADAPWIQLAVKLLQVLIAGMLTQMNIGDYVEDLAFVVPALAKQLAIQQSYLKFEVLLLLRTLVASDVMVPLRVALKSEIQNSIWPSDVRTGIVQILNNRVVADQKHLALELAESLVEIVGETWLLGPMILSEEGKVAPEDRFFILLVETVRVETAVILNELARLRFDLGDSSVGKAEELTGKQRTLATCYALLENIMNAIIERPDYTPQISESSLIHTMTALDETIGVVLEVLEDAKRHGIRKGDDLMASVRLVGRYLAEVPIAHQRRFLGLLQYLFSISTDGEESSFLVVHFLLPALCQATTEIDACTALVSWGGHKQVVDYILAVVGTDGQGLDKLLVEACDILLNILQKKHRISVEVDVLEFLPALPALCTWAVNSSNPMEYSLAACVCVMVLDLTSEQNLAQMAHEHNLAQMASISDIHNLIIKILQYCQQSEILDEPPEEEDLWDITISTCAGFMDRYPSLKHSIRTSTWLQQLLHEKDLTEADIQDITLNPSLQLLFASIMTRPSQKAQES